ncbi:MAG TPA: DMT family transporter [Rhodocyclaceae bacterium]|nr:DMT family transporter [Rhodocyclaceae bacterium]HRQ45462.1 DMT family transporter [Rhodocyclaceae bacterium]
MRRPAMHWLLLIGLVAMWGSSFMLTKVAVSSLAPATVVAGRLAIAAVLLCVWMIAARRRLPPFGPLWGYFVAMSLLGNVLPFLLIGWGQQNIDSGLAGILMAVMPLTTLVLAHFFVDGERLTQMRAGGFVLGFAGIVILVGPQALTRLGGNVDALLGQIAVLGGAICYAVNTIVVRRRPPCDVRVTAAVVLAMSGLLTAPLGAAHLPIPDLPDQAVWAVMLLGVICTAAATVVYFQLVAVAGPTFLSLINYLIPLWAVAMGMIFLAERPDWNALVALLLILAGIALSQRKQT